jgi:hypothetical protein
MTIFWILLFAHFLGDYPLQSNWMVRNKRKLWVVALHAGIHLAVMLVLAWPVGLAAWPVLLALTVFHFFLDTSKIRLGLFRPKWVVVPYIIDQCLHYLSLFLAARVIAGMAGGAAAWFPPQWATIGTALVVVTYFWAITERVVFYAQPEYVKAALSVMWARMLARSGGLLLLLGLLGLSQSLLAGAVPLRGLALVAFTPYPASPYRRRLMLTDVTVTAIVFVLTMAVL